ncbi:MAG: hypothetical protein MUR31_09805 [Burkholderiaceae bacterium]|nr:hypothetical protein [Burkholderiaceae bacterium]
MMSSKPAPPTPDNASGVHKQRGLFSAVSAFRAFRASLLPTLLVCFVGTASAQVPSIFKEADLQLGAELIADNGCVACHQQKFGGDGGAIYRPGGRIASAGLLRGMVEQCNTTLNLSLFPEEVTAIAAVLNQTHYHFKD